MTPTSRTKRAARFVKRWRYTILMSLVALFGIAWAGFLVWALHALMEWVTAQ